MADLVKTREQVRFPAAYGPAVLATSSSSDAANCVALPHPGLFPRARRHSVAGRRRRAGAGCRGMSKPGVHLVLLLDAAEVRASWLSSMPMRYVAARPAGI